MSNKRKFQQSIDTTVKLNFKLREDLIDQFQSFDPLNTNNLLIKLKEILEFKNKKIKVNQSTNDELNIDSEITIYEVEEIVDSIVKLHCFNKLINPTSNLKSKINEIREEIIHKLTLLPSKLKLNEINKLTITDLPSEDLYPLIFRNLSIDDLFNCRLVNKQFKYFSDNTNGIYKLIIGQPDSLSNDYYWHFNNKSIEEEDIISLECFRSIRSKSIFNLDKNLKYLRIYDRKFKLEDLSNLINLESLEFFRYYYHNNPQIINLNNLKFFVSSGLSVKLNAPKLEKIEFNDVNQIKLDSNPESVKHLITTKYDNKLKIFKNLETMELRNGGESINENLLIIFKYLKQLKIFASYSNESMDNGLIKIINDKIKLKRKIDIYLEGVKIENIDKLNELKSTGYPYWKFRLNNYDLLDLNLSSIDYLDYEKLERCVNNIENDLPSNFFDKFQNINHVVVYNVKNVNGLNWFLNNLKQLSKLVIHSNVSLDEVFYNNLPNTIRYLSIFNKEDLNYDFIIKLSKLIEFWTEVDKDLFDLAFTSFSNLKYLKEFKFSFKKEFNSIEKSGKKIIIY